MTTSAPPRPARTEPRHRWASALVWTAVTAAATGAIAYLAVHGVAPEIRRGSQPADVDTLNRGWDLAFLLCLPVYLVARRSALLALPAVAVAVVPQFLVATVGLERMVADDGLESLIYVWPILMTALCLLTALVGAVVRVVALRSGAGGSRVSPPAPTVG